jgi:L-fuconolactonase
VIDSHQHYWKYDPVQHAWIDGSMASIRRDFLPADAKREMEAAGVEACVAVQTRQTLDETRWLLDQAAAHPFIAGVVGWIDLEADVDAQIAALGDAPALAGVRHIVQGEDDGFLEGPAFLSGIARLERHGLAYDILVYERQLPEATVFARRFPRQRFVLDHLGKPEVRGGAFDRWRRQVESLAGLPHVWCKLSGLVTEADWASWTPAQLRPYLDTALEAFGPARVMMGTDWPVCLVAASYSDVVALVTEAIDEYSDDEQRQILGDNARHFWNLK